MRKIIVEIYLPAAQRTFDVQIPISLRLFQAVELIGRTLTELSGGLYSADGTSTLCLRETGEILNINMTVWELELRNGSRLMLI